jgi:hypothetical protein
MLNYFPTISYNFGVTGGTMSIVNIFKSVNIKNDARSILKLTNIQQYERPDQTSYKLFNTFDYYWVLMILNGIKNPLNLWNANLQKIIYIDVNKTEKIKNIVRDSTDKIINIKLSEL